MRLVAIALLSAALIYAEAAYCPTFLQGQNFCSCEEYVDGAIVKCSGNGGPGVVEQLKNVSASVRELWLEHARILQIGPAAFKPLKLKKLVLDNNPISTIDKQAFKGLETSLQELSISMNKLTSVPTDSIDDLRALNILNLKCNNIGNITDVVFNNNPALIEVNLACNQISSIDKTAFKNVKRTLQNLILDNNNFERIPTDALDGMKNLLALHMKQNKLTKLGSKELVNLPALTMITFHNNMISTIEPDVVQNVNNLHYIYLNSNKLSTITPGTMKQFNATEVIDLSYNQLSEIASNTFTGLESLQHLNLESNEIKEIAEGAFSSTPLLLLWLPYNCLTSINQKIFQGTPFLKQISLSNNNIRTIEPLTFAHLANLHTLDLSHNQIRSIENGAITGTDFMTVRLQENPFVCTQDGFHVLNGPDAINLTTEANLVCRQDFHDNTDQCPKRKEQPSIPPCCLKHKTAKTTHAPVLMSTVEETTTEAVTEATTEAQTAATQMSAIEMARQRAQKLNMDRFWRLTRPPPNMQVRPASNDESMVHLSAPKNKIVMDADKPRQRTENYRSQLLPYLRNEAKNKQTAQAVGEFSEDVAAESVQVSETAAH